MSGLHTYIVQNFKINGSTFWYFSVRFTFKILSGKLFDLMKTDTFNENYRFETC